MVLLVILAVMPLVLLLMVVMLMVRLAPTAPLMIHSRQEQRAAVLFCAVAWCSQASARPLLKNNHE
eukprot:6547107-Pyramimonas_sp.AAC.1